MGKQLAYFIPQFKFLEQYLDYSLDHLSFWEAWQQDYGIENFLYLANICWFAFIVMTGSQYIGHLQEGISYILEHKIKADKLPRPEERTWKEVFYHIFKQDNFTLKCLFPTEEDKSTVEYISNKYLK